jgi:hypothetical protein
MQQGLLATTVKEPLMATMATKFPAASVNTFSPEVLRLKFETAIAQVNGDPVTSARTPIVVRKRSDAGNDAWAEKQALAEAAHALSLLWKISPRLVR